MPRCYRRKTQRQTWPESSMQKALEALENKTCGYLQASKRFGVPKSTLERRFKNKNKYATGHSKGLGSKRVTFPNELEKQLVAYIKQMEVMLFGLTTKGVRSLAYQLAVSNNLDHQFNNNTELAGWQWLRDFLRRNKLSLRLPEATSAARARGFNKDSVTKFFDILEPLQTEKHFLPSRIFNVDETGITTVQGRPSKIIAMRGRKQVGTLTSAERGELSTAVICMSASGIFIPPMVILPRVRMKPHFSEGAPPETLVVADKSGWMQLHLFEKWFDHFIFHSQASKENPTLLILDGHKTHTQNLAVIDKARSNGVTILCLPPHCSHRIQPLDVAFMGPLSSFYSQEIEVWLRNHPGRCITVSEVCLLFGKAFLRSATPLNAIKGFQKTGIYPTDRTVFTDDMFAPSVPTERSIITENADSIITENAELLRENLLTNKRHDQRELTPVKESIQRQSEVTPLKQILTEQNSLGDDEWNKPSTSGIQTFTGTQDIVPYPKVSSPTALRKKRNVKRGKAAILTSTPYKDELEKSLEEKRQKVTVKKIASKTKISSLSKEKGKNIPKKKEKMKVVLKINKKHTSDSGDEQTSDVECLYCISSYSNDHHGEGWIMCSNCKKWAHDVCAGAEDEDENFTCDLCLTLD